MAAPSMEQIERVRLAALRLLEARARSRSELTERLLKRHLPRLAVNEVVARFVELGLIDDARFAESVVESELREKPAGEALLRHRLERFDLAEDAADAAIANADQAEPESSRARRFAMAVASRLPGGLTFAARYRRVLAALARRGFDEDTSTAAAESALGPAPGDL